MGINPVDYKVMGGGLANAFEHHFPIVAGWDVAGEVLSRTVRFRGVTR